MTNRLVRWRYFAFTVVVAIALSLASPDGGQSAPQASSDTYKDVYNGWRWWHVYCYRCHGVDAVGTTTAPGFIDAGKKLTRPEFLKKVRNGVPETAMQGWNKLLDDNQIGQIYMYVTARTDKVLPAGRPDEIGPKGGAWIPPQDWPKQK